MKRRSNKYPSVYQRCRPDCPPDRCKTHSWMYQLDVTGADGRRIQVAKGGFPTARAAAEARAAELRRIREGHAPARRGITVGEWLDQWFTEKLQRGELRESTARSYRDHIDQHLKPHLGSRKLTELRPHHITRMHAAIAEERQRQIDAANDTNAKARAAVAGKRSRNGFQLRPRLVAVPRPYGPTTARRVNATLSSALESAIRQGKLDTNPARKAELPKSRRQKVRPWTPEQFGEFLDACSGHRLALLFHVAAITGLRRGELCGLTWDDVDLDRGRIVVRRQRVVVGYRVVEGAPKSVAGEDRVVYLDQHTTQALRHWHATQQAERKQWGVAWVGTGHVFTRENGEPLHPDYVSKTFARLVRQSGLPYVRFHSLRHLAASLRIAAGEEIAAVSKQLGHSSISITSDLYGHLVEKAAKDAVERAAALVPRLRAVN